MGVLGGGDADDIAIAVKEGASGIARVDGAVGLEDVKGGGVPILPGSDEPVQGGHQAAGEGVSQFPQGVADGVDALPHHQLGAVAQSNGGEAVRLDLQHGHIVVLLAAHQLGVVLVSVGERHLDGDGGVVDGALNDVVVGCNIAVSGEDKSGAGSGGGGGLSEDVHRGVHRNAHARGQIGGIQLFRGHGLAVVGVQHRAHLRPLLLIDDG